MKSNERLKMVRKALQLNQSDFGLLVNKTQQTINNWENSSPNMDEETRTSLDEIGVNVSFIDLEKGDLLLVSNVDAITNAQNKLKNLRG